MTLIRRIAAGLIAGGLFWGAPAPASADNNHTVLAGCVTGRTDTSVTLKTTGNEQVTVDTTWLKPSMRDALAADCMTVSTMIVDGKYMAESVDEGIDNETSADRTDRSGDREDDGDKNSGGND